MRSFDTWNYEQVEDAFGIVPIETNPRFTDWLNADQYQPDASEIVLLEHYRKLLLKEVKNWNEDEMKLFFIGPILGLVDFNTDHYKPFTQRTLTIETDTVSASGKVDFMLAKGKVMPKIPYFCLHEYKQENRRDNDPLGQLLIGMVAAQAKNADDLPIYGCYVSGRNWFFVLLDGKQYCLSDAYVATSEDIYTIFAILKKCKVLVEAHALVSR
jgi:hypothetical protein